MKYYYSLRIDGDSDLIRDKICLILNEESNMQYQTWGLEKIIDTNDTYVNYIDYFLKILKGKFDLLENIGIVKSDITIWMLYEYENQCNMEFEATDLKNLGDNGIKLCISCWKK